MQQPYTGMPVSLRNITGTHQDVDLVNKALDAGVAANAKANDGEVDDEEGVEDKHRSPAASPPAVKTRRVSISNLLEALIIRQNHALNTLQSTALVAWMQRLINCPDSSGCVKHPTLNCTRSASVAVITAVKRPVESSARCEQENEGAHLGGCLGAMARLEALRM